MLKRIREEGLVVAVSLEAAPLICLQEAKVEVFDSQLGLKFLGQRLSNFDYIPADGIRGGVLIAWDDELVEASEPAMRDYYLSITLTMKMTNISFLLTEEAPNAAAAEGLKSLSLLTIWIIWKERNNRVFQQRHETVERLLSHLQEEAKNWILAGAKSLAYLDVFTYRE